MSDPSDDDRTINLRECLNTMASSHVGRCLLQGCLPGLKDKEWCQYCGQHMGKPNPPPMGLLGQSPLACPACRHDTPESRAPSPVDGKIHPCLWCEACKRWHEVEPVAGITPRRQP